MRALSSPQASIVASLDQDQRPASEATEAGPSAVPTLGAGQAADAPVEAGAWGVWSQVGLLLGFIVLLGAIKFYQQWMMQRAIAKARKESEQLQKNPQRFTALQLKLYNGRDMSKPLLLALKGRVLDVSSGSEYYGPQGAYKLMAGKDASYAFAMMSLKEEDAHADVTGCPEEHLKILDDWYEKLTKKYPTVGRVDT